MKKNNSIQIMVGAFIVTMIAIAFLTSIVGQTNNVTEKLNSVNETTDLTTSCYSAGVVDESSNDCNITVNNNPTSWKCEDCPITNVIVADSTGTELVLDTDYELYDSIGVVKMLNTVDTNETNLGDVLVSYTYCGDNYVNSSWGRSILGINIGMFAIAILIAVMGAAYLLLDKRD